MLQHYTTACEQTQIKKSLTYFRFCDQFLVSWGSFFGIYLTCSYKTIQMKCQGGVIFVHAPRLFYCPKRRIGYARCSLTGNKNYPAITKLTNTM